MVPSRKEKVMMNETELAARAFHIVNLSKGDNLSYRPYIIVTAEPYPHLAGEGKEETLVFRQPFELAKDLQIGDRLSLGISLLRPKEEPEEAEDAPLPPGIGG